MLMLWINSDYSTHFWSTWRFKRFKTQWSEMLTADSVGGDVKSLVMLEMDGRTSRGEGWGDLNTKWWCLTDERCTTAVIYRHTHSVRVTRIFFFLSCSVAVATCVLLHLCIVTHAVDPRKKSLGIYVLKVKIGLKQSFLGHPRHFFTHELIFDPIATKFELHILNRSTVQP